MRDAWIYGERDASRGEAAHLLAELGYTPRRVAPDALRPDCADGAGGRPPAIALVVGGKGEVCARLRDDEDLGEVPRLLAVEPEALRDRARLHDAHELMVLPLERVELEARIARAWHTVHGAGDHERACVGSLELDLASYRATIDGVPVVLAHLEYELLKFLVTHPRRVFSREALLRQVWGYDFYGGARTVDAHVRRLRAKLGPQHAGCIRTVRGVGYCLEASTS